eukprot:scaffold3759_cov169-Amphora_coffeaeformis.AAC.6
MEGTTIAEDKRLALRNTKIWRCFRNSIHGRRIAGIGDADHTSDDELDRALMQATINGDLVQVQRLTSQGANRHVQHANTMELEDYMSYDRDAFDTPLEAAAWLGHVSIVRYFLRQQRSSRRLVFAGSKRRSITEHSKQTSLDREAFLVACQGGTLEVVQCFVQHFGPSIVTNEFSTVTPLHHACARCHIPMIQYLIAQGARLDTKKERGGVAAVHWLGLYVEMKRIHGSKASPIPLPEDDGLTEESYEAALAWIIQNHPQSIFVPDSKGTTALQKLLKRAPMGLIRTAFVQLLLGEPTNA